MSATAVVSVTAVILALCEAFTAICRQHFGIDFVAGGAEEHGRHEGHPGDFPHLPIHSAQDTIPSWTDWRVQTGNLLKGH